MNTSSGNCMIMVSLVYSYMKTLGIDWRLANNGDDCVLFIERQHFSKLSNLKEWFHTVGFDMAVEEPVDVIE